METDGASRLSTFRVIISYSQELTPNQAASVVGPSAYKDGVEKLIAQTRQEAIAGRCWVAVEETLHFFVHNVDRMQYGTFRKQGWFIGSGVIEAGCKTVIGSRCKQSGMFWSVPGAENILAFRCIHSSRREDAFWKFRVNQHAARNDSLPLVA